MSRILAIALLLACGGTHPLSIAGDWKRYELAAFVGAMAVTQNGDDVQGTFTLSANGVQYKGSLSGLVEGNTVTMRWAVRGFLPWTVMATVAKDRMVGMAIGSGFAYEAFAASREDPGWLAPPSRAVLRDYTSAGDGNDLPGLPDITSLLR
jgi:hypothetical protein